MVTPLPEIPSDVLSLLDGYFRDMEQARLWLIQAVEKHRDAIGDLRTHIWLQALRCQSGHSVLSIHCDECQDEPYGLAVWPIGRGAWACDKHKAIIDARIESEHYRPEPKR